MISTLKILAIRTGKTASISPAAFLERPNSLSGISTYSMASIQDQVPLVTSAEMRWVKLYSGSQPYVFHNVLGKENDFEHEDAWKTADSIACGEGRLPNTLIKSRPVTAARALGWHALHRLRRGWIRGQGLDISDRLRFPSFQSRARTLLVLTTEYGDFAIATTNMRKGLAAARQLALLQRQPEELHKSKRD
ncbi:hypothetical protein BDZ45DRAFT_742674 [Acephala macrosclerotiorum]|nr:hypothetical protein BDZ45DRAFT_742674 [Acephala macrosclerotiorum]